MFLPGDGAAAGGVRVPAAREPAPRAPGRRGRAGARRRRLREREPARRRRGGCSHARRSSSTSTITTTTPASATSTSSTRRRRRPARCCATCSRELGVELTPGDRRGALRRARHRHGPLPVREHDAEGAAARGRAASRRAPTSTGLPGRLRERPVREAEAARPRARAGAGLRGRRARRLVPAAGRLRRGGGGRAVLGGDHRLPPRGRGRRHGRADSRAARVAAARAPDLACAPRTTSSTSPRSRASPDGGGHRQAAGFSSDDSIEEITAFLAARVRRRVGAVALMPPKGLEPSGIILVDKPAGPSSFAVAGARPARDWARRRAMRELLTLSRPACCFCCPVGQQNWRRSSSVSTSATSRTSI